MKITELSITCNKIGDRFDVDVAATLDDNNRTIIESKSSMGMENVSNKRLKAISKCINLALEDIVEKTKFVDNE